MDGVQPPPSKTYSGRDSMDVEYDYEDLNNALCWISDHPVYRDFVTYKPRVVRLPESQTASTFPVYECIVENDLEGREGLVSIIETGVAQ